MPEPLLRVFVFLSQQPRRNEEGRGGVGREGGEAKGTHALQRSHPEMGLVHLLLSPAQIPCHQPHYPESNIQ